MRSVPEWIGRDDDTPVPPRVKVRVFDRFGGVCQCGCHRKITAGERWDAHHAVALILGGQNRENNLVPLLTEHHKNATRSDVMEKSRAYKRRASHLGVRRTKYRWPAGKESKWKRTVSGRVVLRKPMDEAAG